jgi:hypothetical protein
MYPEEFAKNYAAKSNMSMEALIENSFVVIACACGEDGCLGWQMQTEAWVEERKSLGLWDDATKWYYVKDIYLGESPEEYYALHYPDMDEESLAMCLAMDHSSIVCTLSCECGRTHEIEYTPPPHEWYSTGITCACGRSVTYGK